MHMLTDIIRVAQIFEINIDYNPFMYHWPPSLIEVLNHKVLKKILEKLFRRDIKSGIGYFFRIQNSYEHVPQIFQAKGEIHHIEIDYKK